jgi:hypothetical protein
MAPGDPMGSPPPILAIGIFGALRPEISGWRALYAPVQFSYFG